MEPLKQENRPMEALPQYVYCSDVSCRQPQLLTQDGRTLKVLILPGQPPIVRDPLGKINGGKPTSVYDLLYEQHAGTKLPKGVHAVPARTGGQTVRDYSTFEPTDCQLLTAAQIHAEYVGKGGRGRKPSLGVREAASVKSLYYSGKATLRDMADGFAAAPVSEAQAGLIVRGRRYWYA